MTEKYCTFCGSQLKHELRFNGYSMENGRETFKIVTFCPKVTKWCFGLFTKSCAYNYQGYNWGV